MRQVATICLLACLAALAGGTASRAMTVNRDFTVEDCGTPLAQQGLIGSMLYKHPDTGKTHLFLEYGNNSGYGLGEEEWEQTGHYLIDVELESGEMRTTQGPRPGSVTSYHFYHPSGKVLLFEAKTQPSSLAAYDVRTGKVERLFATSNSANKKRIGKSGRVYIGEVGGSVSMYDFQTKTATLFREVADRPTFYGTYSMEVDEPWIYCGMTHRGKWFLSIVDSRSGEHTNYFDSETGQPELAGHVAQTLDGRIYYGKILLKDGKPQLDAHGTPIGTPPKPEEFPTGYRSYDPPWPDMWRITGYGGNTYPEALEGLGLEFDMSQAEPNQFNGGVATIRWRKKDAAEWRTIRIEGMPLIPSSPKCLGVGPDGVMVGVGSFYGDVFCFDPRTGKTEKIGPPPGSVYEVLPLRDRTYFCGYVSYLAEWLHDKPYAIDKSLGWENDVNPKRYRTSGKWTTILVEGPDGRIYTGGRNGRHTTGGGVAIFDPKTKEMETLRDPWFHYLRPTALAFIDGGKTLVIPTRVLSRGAAEAPKQGSIFLYDVASRKIVKEIKLAESLDADELFVAGDGTVIGVTRKETRDQWNQPTCETLVFGLDLANGKATFRKTWPGRAFTGVCQYDMTPVVLGPDGCGWLFVDEDLCRIQPDGRLEHIRKLPEYRGKMIWQGRTLYIYNGGRMYFRRFANVVRIPDLFEK